MRLSRGGGRGGRGLLLALLLEAGCHTSRPTARCSILASPVGAESVSYPPQLLTMAENPAVVPAPMALRSPRSVHCAKGAHEPAYMAGSPMDDLTAIRSGSMALNGQTRTDCPALPERLTLEPPAVTEAPCGEGACANEQVTFAAGSGVRIHILFYDDPSSHHRETDAGPESCYYRVYALSLAWDGKAPQ